LCPQLRADGYPMDFIHDTDPLGKVAMWRRGVDRVFEQHPYAALLVGRHAALLYALDLPNLAGEVYAHVAEFIADQRMLLDVVRHAYAGDSRYSELLGDEYVDANTRLLQFGDHTSLQVTMPWAAQSQLRNCPLNVQERIDIEMSHNASDINFVPWPFGIDQFTVEVHGKLLSERYFASAEAYHAALAEAPLQRMTWQVVRE